MSLAKLRSTFLMVTLLALGWSASAGAADPVFHWSFDEGAGTRARDSVGENEGLLNGAQWSTGRLGGAVQFDGQDDYIQLQDDSLDGLGRTFTVCAWIWRDADDPTGHGAILGYGDAESNGWFLYCAVTFDRLFFSVRPAGNSNNDCLYSGSTDIQPGRWCHVAIVVDDTEVAAFINGQAEEFVKWPESECEGVYGFSDIDLIAEKATIGALERIAGPIHHFNGRIDELMVFDQALTQSDISVIYGQYQSAIAHWKFDEGTGEIALDSVGDNDGIVRGAERIAGWAGGALRFDGHQDYVEIPDSTALDISQDVTLAAWVKVNGPVAWPRIVGKGGDGDYQSPYGLMLDGDSQHLVGYIGDGTSWNEHVYTEEALVQGTWYHLAMTYSTLTNTMKLYLNGDEVFSTRETGDLITTDAPLGIGAFRYRNDWQGFFDGSIDDVRIYDRVLTSAEISQLSQPAGGRTLHVDVDTGSDDNDGNARETAFETIQKAIDTAGHADTVLVWPGLYLGPLDFKGKAITVRSAAHAATIMGLWENAVTMQSGEGPDSVLENFVIADSLVGIAVQNGSTPTLRNLTVVYNDVGIEADSSSDPAITNCIVWANSQESLVGCSADYSMVGQQYVPDNARNSISGEPAFAEPDLGDYHLRSERGRYWPQYDIWVLDDVTSPCIDAGDPNSDFSAEPLPNGRRINIGAYGGTPYASMSEPPVLIGDLNLDGVVNLADLALMGMNWLETEPTPPGQ